MRYWVKPDQLAKLNITVGDVIQAIQSQNTVNPAGHDRRASRRPKGQEFTYSVRAQGRLTSPGGVRRDRDPRQSGRLDRAAAGTSPGSSLAPRSTT